MEIKNKLNDYKKHLENNELTQNTITKYLKDVAQLQEFLNKNNLELQKESLIKYKKQLQSKYKISTVNNKIITINKFLKFIGLDDCTLKQIKEQTKNNNDEIMTQTDYNRLIRVATNKGLDKDVLMLQVFYETGLRVSELKFFTVEAVKKGYMTISNKGKIRNVPVTRKLQKAANKYIKDHKIKAGAIICNSNNEPISRFTVYNRLKYIAGQARVKKSRVYPHSIRHLFAKNWLKNNGNNILQLADILGHSSLETTRLYTKLNTDELRATMEF